ncbi:MAG: UDP-N-acetylmuramate dehydrogenase [Anaerolineae bacterium]
MIPPAVRRDPEPAAEAALRSLETTLKRLGLDPRRDVPLRDFTTFRIGGPADLLVTVRTPEQLGQAAIEAERHGIPWWILGGGSNVLISDGGVRGLTIVNRCRRIERTGATTLRAESGALMAGVARVAIRAGLGGLEWAVSVPGTVGGAVVGNAGAHGGCIADSLVTAEAVLIGGERLQLTAAELQLGYRTSRFKTGELRGVILAATFALHEDDAERLSRVAASYLDYRRRTQPTEASVGSIFRNPPGDYAGRLIEAAGLKGLRRGDAQVSPVHANFIVNLGNATASDVKGLVQEIQQRVFASFGVRLEPEILFCGDDVAV